jgi:hypothetical protein
VEPTAHLLVRDRGHAATAIYRSDEVKGREIMSDIAMGGLVLLMMVATGFAFFSGYYLGRSDGRWLARNGL